ncbi:SDR family NAD(P)-dependent oxidoreductase [Sorangium sp. So ce1014]|uniref:SDR family NAD(P)-dependent oxidoreductase n=1 Tax=Sorangium sp. So ce1014 TaxID=3133326 RepID=UPI003F61CB76
MSERFEPMQSREIAIIGMSGRFPGARNLREFWANLVEGRVSIGEVPASRWDAGALYDPDPKSRGKSVSKWGGFIDDADAFDPRFFRITPRDAVYMDPQQRLFLEESWKTFEDAGYSDRDLDGARCGVFVGCKIADYLIRLQGLGDRVEGHAMSGNDISMLPARLSYFLNLRGPSLPINTACSSSMVALHLACESLLGGTCDMALVGGVELMTSPGIFQALSSAGALAPSPECRPFDDRANGVVLGEGVCAVLLKPLAAALADGDPIRGVIKCSGINQDGRSSGISAPNGASQTALVTDIYRRAGIDPETIGYVEAHGTGTALGDPIEIHALTDAFGHFTRKRRYCPIGSLKANIGHPLSAAGLAGIIKVLLCLEHGQLPPAAGFSRENRLINFEDSPFFVNTALRAWPQGGSPRRAAVSSFGFSGTNAHVVVEEPPVAARQRARSHAGPHLVLLSAKTEEALRCRVDDLRRWLLEDRGRHTVTDVAYTLHRGRAHFSRRLALVADSADDLVGRLERVGSGAAAPSLDRASSVALKAVEDRIARHLHGGGLGSEGHRGALMMLGDLYLRGYLPDWRHLHPEGGARVPLPIYPFTREHYWLPWSASTAATSAAPAAQAAPSPSPVAASSERNAGELRLLRDEWVPASLPASTSSAGADLPEGDLLLFGRDEALWRELQARVAGPRRRVVLVEPGADFGEVGSDRFTVRLAHEEDFERLVAAVRVASRQVGAILVLSSASGGDEGEVGIEERLDAGPRSLFALCRALAKAPPRRPLPIVCPVPLLRGAPDPVLAALTGFARTLDAEAPTLKLKTVALGAERAPTAHVDILLAELTATEPGGTAVRYDGDRRLRRRFILEPPGELHRQERGASLLRRGGVYVVTGGAGGIGAILAEHLARTVGARLVLAGRSGSSEKTDALLARVRERGGEALYVQAELARRADVERLIDQARDRFGRIHGIFHVAGVHRDALVRNKRRSDIDAVLGPKVLGTLHLDSATADADLDLFVLFSSLAAVLANPGQADYAYANAFLDAFAVEREARRARGERRGRTSSLNWPYWQDGGMRLAAADVEAIRLHTGLMPMPSAAGLRALDEAALREGFARHVVLYGDAAKLEATLAEQSPAPPERAPAERRGTGENAEVVSLRREVDRLLRNVMAKATQLGPEEIDPEVSFTEYGVDSVTIKEFNVRLDELVGALPRTLLFEHDNLRSLSDYLARHHTEALRRALGQQAEAPPREAVPPRDAALAGLTAERASAGEPRAASMGRPDRVGEQAAGAPLVDAGDIAVIGVHGRYPGADDLETFWKNLAEGKDSVTEIPAGRWRYIPRYDPDPERSREGAIYCKWGGFLDGVDHFDAKFFGVSPREAEVMDPQERLFLETAWATFEDAGYTRERLRALSTDDRGAPVGVFVGVTTNTYLLYGPEEWQKGNLVTPVSAPWSIANRVSYLLDLTGPSVPVDTACSSSLVALHFAVQSLRRGECRMALVGGVNLYLHPSKYVNMCQVHMLSPTGRCHAFGADADGFVPGEGVGAVLLKPLDAAIRDGDHIYGVIKGSAVNHGGKTNSYSVPNPNAHTQLIKEALRDAAIDASTITYVEAHGTGTALGDPIEVRGLTNAFLTHTTERGFCALGTVKTNIGHLEAAAGIAGLTKLLLQLERGQIAPSLHADRLNEDLQLDTSPFYVARRLAEWRPADGAPRRAGLSSFGAGGVNAHVIVEEAPADLRRAARAPLPAVAVLSAKSERALRTYAEALLGHVRRRRDAIAVEEVAYTLQVGRQPMSARLALVVSSLDELERGLEGFLAGRHGDVEWVSGEVTKNGPASGSLLEGEEGAAFLRAALENRRVSKLARLWVEGMPIDWSLLHAGATPRRVPLPTYPFERRRYWIPTVEAPRVPAAAAMSAEGAATPLPFPFERTAAPDGTKRFRVELRGDEFYLRDHIIDGRPVLPGVVLLEMARAAGELSEGKPVRGLRQVVWVKPIAIDGGPREIEVVLRLDGPGALFEVRSSRDGATETHAQGRLDYGPPAAVAQPPVDLRAIERRCPLHRSAGECYPERGADRAAVRIGPSLRSIVGLWSGDREVLAELALPPHLDAELGGFFMHPALLDGAVQVVVSFGRDAETELRWLFFPFSVDAVEIFRPFPRRAYAHARLVHGGTLEGASIVKLDVEIVDEEGALLAKLAGAAFRIVDRGLADERRARAAADTALLYYTPEWVPSPLPALAGRPEALGPVLLLDMDGHLHEALRRRLDAGGGPQAPVVLVHPGPAFARTGESTFTVAPGDAGSFRLLVDDLAAQGLVPSSVVCAWGEDRSDVDEGALRAGLESGLYTLSALSQALATQKGQQIQVLHVHRAADAGPRPSADALASWVLSANLEARGRTAKALTIVGSISPSQLADIVLAELDPASRGDAVVRIEGGKRWVRSLRACDLGGDRSEGQSALRRGGVVLLAGGAGALGRIFARHLAERVGARLVLIGRSAPAARQEQLIASLQALGSEAIYLQADLARRDDVVAAVEQARARFGNIHGVIHAAGLLTEGYVAERQRSAIEEVVGVKVLGALHLDQATRDEPLDFFVTFSSTASELGGPAQADYAFASGFLDRFAAWREEARGRGQRAGKTRSIGWSPWEVGTVDANVMEWLRRTIGVVPLAAGAGIASFERALSAPWAQVVVLAGARERIARYVGERRLGASGAGAASAASSRRPTAPTPGAASAPAADSGSRIVALGRELLGLAAELLKQDPSEMDLETELSEYGFESISLIEFTNAVNRRYSVELMPTAFFEHRTFHALASHILDAFPAALAAQRSASPGPAAREEAKPVDEGPGERQPASAPVAEPPAAPRAEPPAAPRAEPIAIVGISGVMPSSEDLQVFWENLRAGRALITETPASRWRWQDHGEASRWGGFMPGVDQFDPLFFGISPREAALMDPQHRLLLEHTWKAIEDAGHRPSDLAGTRTAVFVGVMNTDYAQLVSERLREMEAHAPIGNSLCMLPNRLSYFFDFHGPSQPVDTGCSSATIAVHRAIKAIQADGCEMAIAGGVNVMLSPMQSLFFKKAGILSRDHRCRAFDKDATGTVRGEGVGAILLKPLSRALADGNPIYAVIRASGENHGGHARSLTAPNPRAQADLVADVHEAAGIDPTTVGYIETHGTGTTIGDPIEVDGLKKAFDRLYRSRGKRVDAPHIGLASVKTNVGHLEPAAGIAAIFKVLLALKHRFLPANLHFEALNPFIKLDGTPFYILDKPRPWDAPRDAAGRALPRVAGVSSFGMGGANAHLVLEELQIERRPAQPAADIPQLVVLSARSEDRLKAYAERLLTFLGEGDEATLEEIAYTLQVGRESMEWRFATVVSNKQALFRRLRQFLRGEGAGSEYFCGVANGSSRARATDPIGPGNGAEADARRLEELAIAWTRGASIDVARLHAVPPRRVPLPTYPFARTRCWLGEDGSTLLDAAPPPASSGGVHPAAERKEAVSEDGGRERGDRANGQSKPAEAALNGRHRAGEPTPTPASDRPPEAMGGIVQRLRRIASEQLGASPDILLEDEPLAKYGMDSINLTTFLGRLSEEFGLTLEPAAFLEHPTLRSIAQHLQEELPARSAPREVPPRAAERARPALPPEVVVFNAKGSRPPSFWVPGAYGFVESFISLAAALGPDYPVYSFRSRGNDGKRMPFARVEEMAAYYAEQVRAIHPGGPYLLGGYSWGGLVALETAQILARRGECIGKLVLLDTYPPTEPIYRIMQEPKHTSDIKLILANYLTGHGEWSQNITREDLDGVPPRLHLAHLATLVAERGRTRMARDEIFGYLRGATEVSEYAAESYATYRPAPYDASDVLYFRSQEGADDYINGYDYIRPWKDIVRSRLDVIECPVSHAYLTGERALEIILGPLKAALSEIEVRDAAPLVELS